MTTRKTTPKPPPKPPPKSSLITTNIYRDMPEVAWHRTVVDHAMRASWLVYFIPDAMWRRAFANKTPQALGNRGFPDLVLAHPVRGLKFRELKRQGGKLSPYQIIWRDTLLAAGADWALWTPDMLDSHVIPELWGTRMEP
jgi:hypothetical protein